MSLGLRELVWIAVGLLGVYAVMQLGRLYGLRRAAASVASETPEAAPPPESFGLELELRQLRREVVQLRDELEHAQDAWQETAQRLEAEVLHLREALASMQADHGAAPQYGEALVFARRGLDPESIAERCGISVAEADLVRALAQAHPRPPGEQP